MMRRIIFLFAVLSLSFCDKIERGTRVFGRDSKTKEPATTEKPVNRTEELTKAPAEEPITTEEPVTTQEPKDCNEVCEGTTGQVAIGDSCCSLHYCRCGDGLALSSWCNEGEGFCDKTGKCTAGCSAETCCDTTTTVI